MRDRKSVMNEVKIKQKKKVFSKEAKIALKIMFETMKANRVARWPRWYRWIKVY